MKILITAGRALDPNGSAQDGAIRATSDVYAVNLARELQKRGIAVTFSPVPGVLSGTDLTPEEIAAADAHYAALDSHDHAICTLQNGFVRRHPAFFRNIRARTRGKVCTIFDHDRGDGPEDLILHARRPTGHAGARGAYIGWAADDRLFAPAKEDGWLTVFVDHKYYGDPDTDWTERLIGEAQRFCRNYEAGKFTAVPGKERARVIFLGPKGLATIEAPNVRRFTFGATRREWMRRVPQAEIAAALAKADIYLVTHSETMGLATLEAAMAGALIVTPSRFIRPELLQPLHHVTFEHRPDWAHILRMLDVEQSVRLAGQFSWARLTDRLLAALAAPAAPRPGPGGDRPQVEGRHLVGALEDLTAWRALGSKPAAKSIAGRPALHLRAKPGEGIHELRGAFAKPPWPTLYTVCFTLSARAVDGASLALVSPLRKGASAAARFDLRHGRVRLATGAGGWQMVGARIRARGDGVWQCLVQAMSDHLPAFEVRIAMLGAGEPVFTAPDDAALEITDGFVIEGLALRLD